MKALLKETREAIESSYDGQFVAGRGQPLTIKQKHTKGNGRNKKTITKELEVKRIMLSTFDRMFSVEMLGRGKFVRGLRFTSYGEGDQLAKSLGAICKVLSFALPDWEDHQWLIDTAVSMPAQPEKSVIAPQGKGQVELLKLDMRGIPVLFVKVQ